MGQPIAAGVAWEPSQYQKLPLSWRQPNQRGKIDGTFRRGLVSALVLHFDVAALPGAPQIFIMKPVKATEVRLAQSFASDNQTFPDPIDFGPRNHFGL